jgi:hypothetical protein
VPGFLVPDFPEMKSQFEQHQKSNALQPLKEVGG